MRTVAPVLHRIGGQGHQPRTDAELLAPGPPSKTVPQWHGGGDDQGLELAAGVGGGGHDAGAGGVQDPERLPVAALAWRGEVVAG